VRKALFLFSLVCFFVSSALSQQAEQGLYPGITYDSDILGNVNLTTGTVAIKHSFLSLPQWKGFSGIGDLQLNYNTPAWTLQITCDADNDDGGGNTCSAQWLPSDNSNFSVVPQIDSVTSWWATMLYDSNSDPTGWELQASTPDGGIHTLVPIGSSYRSIDGTNLILNSTATQLTDPNGTVYIANVPSGTLIPNVNNYTQQAEYSLGYPMTATNIHGQSLSYLPGPLPTPQYAYPDSLGRFWISQETSDYTGCSGPLPIGDAYILSVQDQQKEQHPIVKECLVAIPVVTAFNQCHGYDPCDFSDMGSQTPGFVQSLVFSPNGSWTSGNAWTFLYGRTDFSSPDYVNYGVLTGIQTPQGGTVTYNMQPVEGNLIAQSRTLNAGDGSGNQVTTYTYNSLTSTTVGNPDTTTTVHSFDVGSRAETAIVFQDGNGTTVKSVSKTYTSVYDPYQGESYPPAANSYETSETESWPNGISCATQKYYPTVYSYTVTFPEHGNPNPPTISGTAPNGEAATESTYDCSSGSNPPLLSSVQHNWMDSQTAYYNLNLFGLPQQDTQSDGSGNNVSQMTYNYDQNGEPGPVGDLTSVSQWLNTGGAISTSVYYDSNGQPVKTVDPSGNPMFMGYDSTDLTVTSLTATPTSSGVTLTASSAPDPFSYLPTGQTDPNGASSTQNYDGMLRPVGGILANGASFSTAYSPASGSQLAMEIRTQQMNTSGATTSQQTILDGFGRVIQLNQQTENNGQVAWYQQDTCYDNMGRVASKSYSYATLSASPAAHSCSNAGDTFSYDALGRLVKTTHQDGTFSTVQYQGRATLTTDENSVSRITQVDGLGRTTAVCELSTNANMPGSGSPGTCGLDIAGTGFLTIYNYNLASHTTTVTQGVQQRVFRTDSAGRTIYTSEPERGVTTYGYAYNSTGLVVTRQRPAANQMNPAVLTTTTTQYDSLGRIVSISYNDGVTLNKNYAYDMAYGLDWTNLGASKGRLAYAWTGSYFTVSEFAYDSMGNIVQAGQCLPNRCDDFTFNVKMAYTYDLAGNLIKDTYFLGASSGTEVDTNYSVSPAGEVLSISNTLTGSTNYSGAILPTVQNGPYGPTNYQFGNGRVGLSVYDTLGRLTGKDVCNESDLSCSQLNFTYEMTSTIRGSQVTQLQDTSLQRSLTMTYDEFGRLASTINSGSDVTSAYTYDRWGNRWTETTAPYEGSPSSVSFNTANNQMLGVTYDAAGNLIGDGTSTFSYDAEGNQIARSAGGTSSVYDALNHRVQYVQNGSNTQYAFNPAGQRVSSWQGTSSTPTLIEATTYWNGQMVSYFDGTGTSFTHYDAYGTKRAETSYMYIGGYVDGWTSTYTSLPFGDGYGLGYGNGGLDGDSNHFALMDDDGAHAQFREYSPGGGRWMSPDPYDGSYDLGNPQSLNRYSYLLNNPLGSADPSGLKGCDEAAPLGSEDTCYDPQAEQNKPLPFTIMSSTKPYQVSGTSDSDGGQDNSGGASGGGGSGEGNGGSSSSSRTGAHQIAAKAPNNPCAAGTVPDPSVSASTLNNYLGTKNSPMVGQGTNLMNSGGQYNIDPRLLVSLAGAETGFGNNITAGQFNAFNVLYHGLNSPFASFQSAINSVGHSLTNPRNGYDFTSTATLYGHYCYGNCSAGLKNLNTFMNQQGADINSLRYPCKKKE
jgi:RHS repeat-associated protein